MTDRRTRRAITRLQSKFDPVFLAHATGRRNAARAPWYRQLVLQASLYAVDPAPSVSTYGGAKLAAVRAANRAVLELHRPSSSLNHATVRVAGKPYHWRRALHTEHLKLVAGESPW